MPTIPIPVSTNATFVLVPCCESTRYATHVRQEGDKFTFSNSVHGCGSYEIGSPWHPAPTGAVGAAKIGDFWQWIVPVSARTLDGDSLRAYLMGLKPPSRVQETDRTSGLRGRQGTIYINETGSTCVRWDKLPGETGYMGTTVTGGTRRLVDVPPECANDVPLPIDATRP